jgi:hypothetical protein
VNCGGGPSQRQRGQKRCGNCPHKLLIAYSFKGHGEYDEKILGSVK